MRYKEIVTTLLLCSLIFSILEFPINSFAQEHKENSKIEISTIEKAMKSPKDEFGIPNDLYLLDSQLLKYKNEIEKRKEFYKDHGTKIFTYGMLSACCGILILALSDGSEYAFWGVIGRIKDHTIGGVFTALGIGYGIYGLSVKMKPVSSDKLTNYYREQYKDYFLNISLNFKF